MHDYTAFAVFSGAYLFALRRAGFSLREIQQMSPAERIELGNLALREESFPKKPPA